MNTNYTIRNNITWNDIATHMVAMSAIQRKGMPMVHIQYADGNKGVAFPSFTQFAGQKPYLTLAMDAVPIRALTMPDKEIKPGLLKIGEKGGRVGELIANQLQLTRYPGKLVIVHHITNYPDRVQLEVEIRAPDHSNATFARINL